MTASVLCHSPKKNNNCLVKAKVKRTELLSAELMLHPIYLSIYLSIYWTWVIRSQLTNLANNDSNFGVQIPSFLLQNSTHSPTLRKWSPKEKLPPKPFTSFTISPPKKNAPYNLYIIYIYTKIPSALSKMSKLSKCSISHETHQMLFFGVFKRMDQETIKAPPCGSPGPELHFPVLASHVPSSWAQLRASGMAVQWRGWHLKGGFTLEHPWKSGTSMWPFWWFISILYILIYLIDSLFCQT